MADKKPTYTPAQKKAIQKYMKEVDEIKVRFPKGQRERYKQAAEKAGQSLNQFVIVSMDQRIERESL